MPGFTTRPEIRGTFGVVATTHWLASAVGMSVLERGGNAFDAAVAVGFTLQVVEPHLNGPLGEAPILVYTAKNRRCDMICGQGVAPAAATIARFKSLGLDLIPGTGLLAATVPGAFDAWMRLLRDYGTLPLGELIAPALGYAETGRPPQRSTCRAATRQSPAGCSAIPPWRRRTAASSPKPRQAAVAANSSSIAPETPGIAALLPTRSTAFAAPRRCSTPRAGGMAGY
jgi:gamma-glutamyltranspeptidase